MFPLIFVETIPPPLIDSTGTVTLSSIVYNYTIRTAYAGSFGQIPELLTSSQYFSSPYAIIPYAAGATLGAITTGPIGTSGTTGTAVASTYTSGNYYLDGTYTLSITQGNVSGGIQCLLLIYGYTYSPIQFQVYFTSPIPKDNTKALTLTLRFSWSRG